MKSVLTRNGRLRVWVVPTLIVLIVVCAAAAMLIGRFSVSLEDVVAALRARFWGGPAVSPRVNWLFAFKGVGGVGIRRSGGGSVGGSFGG